MPTISMLRAPVFVLALVAGVGAQENPPPRPKVTLPEGPGMQLVKTECVRCHALDNITSHKLDREGWENVVDRMITLGAKLQAEQADTIIDYLTKNFGKAKPSPAESSKPAANSPSDPTPSTINVNKATAKELQVLLDLSPDEAQALIAARTRHGDFKNLADLERVPGIPVKRIEARKSQLVF